MHMIQTILNSLGGGLVFSLALFTVVVPAIGAPQTGVSAEITGIEMPCNSTAIDEQEINGRGVVTWQCALTDSESRSDTATVVDRSGSFTQPFDWHSMDAFVDSTWIFDYQGDGTAELVANYHRDGMALVASLYDRNYGAEQALDRLKSGQPVLEESATPVVVVTAPDGWWVDGSRTNFNLDIRVDGHVHAGFSPPGNQRVTDGVVDYVARIRDTDRDGRPDYDLRTVHKLPSTTPSSAASFSSYLMVNATDNEAPLDPSFSWPYLGQLTYGYLTNSPHEVTQPPIQIDWEAGEIAAVGEFVSSRGNDSQWFVYSFEEIEPGTMSQPDFENPFAWYDLANDQDRQSELAIRFGYYWPEDPSFMQGRSSYPANFVRYSWDQDNNGTWDYKLGLLGKHEVESVVTVGDLELKTLPYDELPGWIVDREWGVASFVAAEQGRGQGEGIYDWDPPRSAEDAYFAGKDVTEAERTPSIGDGFADLKTGFRGEYQFVLQDKARLYLSPVDRKLHLYKAETGIWNISDDTTVHYADRDRDGYLDEWRYVRNDRVQRQLNAAAGHLVYSDWGGVVIRDVGDLAPVFEAQPPRNHSEWRALEDQLAQTRKDFGPADFQDMMAQFDDGSEWRVPNTSMTGFRVTEDGYRFVLDLQSNADPGDLPVTGISEPGRYVVEYNSSSDSFSATPSSPPAPVIESVQINGPSEALVPVEVVVQLENQGLEDATSASIVVTADHPDRPPQLIMAEPIDLIAGARVATTASWSPPSSGEWEVTAHLYSSAAPEMPEQTKQIEIASSGMPPWQTVISGGWPSTEPTGYLLLLLAAAGALTGGGLLLLRRIS